MLLGENSCVGSDCNRQEIISGTLCRDILHTRVYSAYMVMDRLPLNSNTVGYMNE